MARQLTPKQAENLYTFKTERFKIRPDHATIDEVKIEDAAILSPKVQNSVPCSLFAAALLVAVVAAGLVGAL